MDSPSKKCVVCGRFTSLFNYGAHSCSACGSFFRRSLAAPKYFDNCQNDETCYKDFQRAVHFECKFCRFHKCVYVGMINTSRFTHLAKLINELSLLDKKRENAYLTSTVPNDFKPDQLFNQNAIKLIKKPSDVSFNCYEWGFINQITIMEYLKQFGFAKFLSSQDLNSFLKTSHFTHAIVSSAMRSYSCKQDFMSFPGGLDIFPACIKDFPYISSNFLNKIRCQLMNRFIELKITNEEYLLLSAILFSNPAIANLSDTGRRLLGFYQYTYSSSLLQYCLKTHQQNGPTRFHELLSVFHVVYKTDDDLKKYLILFQYCKPENQPKPLHQELLQLLMCKYAE